jgi:amino acid permease
LAIVILVTFSYPLQAHPSRASINAVINWRPTRKTPQSSNESSPPRNAPLIGSPKPPTSTKNEIGEMRFAIITTIIIVLSYIVAMTVSSLEKVLAYVGSTGSTTISFILPGLFYYKISDPESPHHQRLIKEDDDEEDFDDEDVEVAGSESQGMLSGIFNMKAHRQWRRDILRKMSLGLAIYGVVVMVVCLGTNTFLVTAH